MSPARGNPPDEAISYGIPIAYAPRDRRILAYGPYGWDSPEGSLGWLVVEWDPYRGFDDEGNAIGGWVSVTGNPYRDHMDPTHYAPLPCDPPCPQTREST